MLISLVWVCRAIASPFWLCASQIPKRWILFSYGKGWMQRKKGKYVCILVLHYCCIQWYFATYNTNGPNNIQLLQIIINYWVAWATPTKENESSPVRNSLLILVYVALKLSSSLCILVSSMLLSLVGLKIGNHLFSNLHRGIFRAPMSFDATPFGWILNQASTDQSAVYTLIPTQPGALAFAFIQILGIIAVMSQISWMVFIVFIPVGSTCIWYHQYYIPSTSEVTRLSLVSRAPIIHNFGESMSGTTTIISFD